MDRIRLLFKLADQETKNGNYQKAIDSYKEIADLADGDIRTEHIANWGMGEIYLNNKEYGKAKLYLNKAVTLDPTEASYRYLLGCAYTYTNEIDEALYHLKKAVELDDTEDIYWNQLGWVMGYNRDFNTGVEYLKKALQINSGNTKTLKDICILYGKNKKWGEAIVCIEEAIRKNPEKEFTDIKKDLEFFKSEFERLST